MTAAFLRAVEETRCIIRLDSGFEVLHTKSVKLQVQGISFTLIISTGPTL